MKTSKGKNWPGSRLFQAKESHLVSKCWTAKQTWFQLVEGWERRGEGEGTSRGGEERRRGTVDPNSQTKMDFLICPNCISTGSFSKAITGMTVPKSRGNNQTAYLTKRKITHLQWGAASPKDQMITTCLQLQLFRFLLAKGDQVFRRAAVSLGQKTHTQTYTHAHIHTCTRDICSILSASSSPHSMVPNTNQQIACLKKKVEIPSYIISPSSGQTLNIFSSNQVCVLSQSLLSASFPFFPLALLLLPPVSPLFSLALSCKTHNGSHVTKFKTK